jgi:hypothetical protein
VLNQTLLNEAAAVLSGRRLYWLLGGSCSGKSTVARLIGRRTGMDVLDMDGLIFAAFMPRYTAERHPAASRWFGASDPLEWALSLTSEEFDALNRASNVEFLDLLAADLAQQPGRGPLLIEGGFTHPSVIAQVAAVGCVACLAADDQIRWQTWETAAERQAMKEAVLALADGRAKWRKFLVFDKEIAETIVTEGEAAGFPLFWRREETTIESMAGRVISGLGLAANL